MGRLTLAIMAGLAGTASADRRPRRALQDFAADPNFALAPAQGNNLVQEIESSLSAKQQNNMQYLLSNTLSGAQQIQAQQQTQNQAVVSKMQAVQQAAQALGPAAAAQVDAVAPSVLNGPAPAPAPTWVAQTMTNLNIAQRGQLADFLAQQTQQVAQLEEQIEVQEEQEVADGKLAPGAPLPSMSQNAQVQQMLQAQAQALQQFQSSQDQQRQQQLQAAQLGQQQEQGLHDLQVVGTVNRYKGWPYHSWQSGSVDAQSLNSALQSAYAPMNQDQAEVTNYLIAQENAAAAGRDPNSVATSEITSNTPQV